MYKDWKGVLIRDKGKNTLWRGNENNKTKAFSRGERTRKNEVVKIVLGASSKNLWNNLELCGSPPIRDRLYV